jgi:DNA invertase Pin-like site-specific DNA recombinase
MGRKPKLTPDQAAEIRDMYAGVWTIAQIARFFRVDAALIHKVLDHKRPYN